MSDVKKILDAEKALNEKWAKVDAREAELRRPAQKVKVMSNEEYARKGKANRLYNSYLKVFIKAFHLRDIRFKKEFEEFLAKYFDQDSEEQRSDAATHLSNTLSLYCQSFHDPYVTTTLLKDESIDEMHTRFPGLEGTICYENPVMTVQIMAQNTSRPGVPFKDYLSWDVPRHTLEGLQKRISPPKFMVDEIEKVSKAKDHLSADTQRILQKIADDSAIKSTLRAVVANACLDTLTVVEESGLAVTQLGFLLPEGAGDIPEAYTDDEAYDLSRTGKTQGHQDWGC